MPQMINQITKPQNSEGVNSQEDPYSKLKKLKELLDMSAITEEEFNETKKRILNNL